MKFGPCLGLFLGVAAVAMAAGPLDGARLSCDRGKLEAIDDGIRLSGRTVEQKATNYFVGTIRLDKPLDLTGKGLKLKFEAENGDAVIALAVRAFAPGSSKPVWAHMRWGKIFGDDDELTARLWTGGGSPLGWQTELVSGGKADRIDRIQIWLGSTTGDIDLALRITGWEVVPEAEARKGGNMPFSTLLLPDWPLRPQYATAPATTAHPTGPFRNVDFNRARENFRRHDWAKQLVNSWRKQAAPWLAMDRSAIEKKIPREDAFFKCLCPNCGLEPEFAWAGNVLQPDGESVKCTRCQTVFPNEKFPEDRTYTLSLPDGTQKTVRYHHGKDQIAAGENWGPRYHITGMINWVKTRNLGTIRSLALLYALEGKKEYAAKVREVLLRYAAVYPGFNVKFRATAYTDPRGHYMAGKSCAWKYHDSGVIPGLLTAYTLTVPSGLYSDADRLAIENGIGREYLWMIMAYPPTGDYCSNAVPAHMNAAAFCAAVLGDHAAMDWVLQGSEGFLAFLKKNYRRDGFWHEATASYANMANGPLIPLVQTLQGYSDPASYTGSDRYDRLDIFAAAPELAGVFKCMAAGTLPTGNLPAVNDSNGNARQAAAPLELLAALQPTPENRALANFFAGTSGDEVALFYRDPQTASGMASRPESLRQGGVFAGGGWALLRRPATADQAAALISFPPFASHAHHSMLNLLICEDGREPVNDLGYLTCWHKDYRWIYSPLAHNIVTVDDRGQSPARYGEVEFFSGRGDGIQAMRVAGKKVYGKTVSRYARTVVDLPLPQGRRYLVDLFEVKGGKNHTWIFHADGIAPTDGSWSKAAAVPKIPGWEYFREPVRRAGNPAGDVFTWTREGGDVTRLFSCPAPGETTEYFCGLTPGQREIAKAYEKRDLPVLLERTSGGESRFLHVIENGGELALAVKKIVRRETPDATHLTVQWTGGRDEIDFGHDGDIAVRRFDAQGKARESWRTGAELTGKIVAVDAAARRVVTDRTALPDQGDFSGGVLQIAGRPDGAYRIEKAEIRDGKVVFVLAAAENVRIAPGERWYTRPIMR